MNRDTRVEVVQIKVVWSDGYTRVVTLSDVSRFEMSEEREIRSETLSDGAVHAEPTGHGSLQLSVFGKREVSR